MSEQKTYPPGHWISLGMSIGMGFGIPFGLLLGQVMGKMPVGFALGPAFGVTIGTAVGSYLEAENRDKIRPLTAEEEKSRRPRVILGVIFLIVGAALFMYLLLIS